MVKKFFIALLVLCAFLLLGSCARWGDIVDYASSQGYTILTKVDDVYLYERDGKVYYADGTSIAFRKYIPRSVTFVK
jgi:hypothetical protein